jgi:hypothetical protein
MLGMRSCHGFAHRPSSGRRSRCSWGSRAARCCRGAGQAGGATADGPDHAVELTLVEIRIAERGDGPGVVEEGVGVGDPGLEEEVVGDVGRGLAAVADVQGVEDVVAELIEVRAPRRKLEGDVVADDGDGARLVGLTKA